MEQLLDRHRAGEDHGERIWNLMVLETWFRELIDGRAAFVREAAAREAEIARLKDRLGALEKRSETQVRALRALVELLVESGLVSRDEYLAKANRQD